MRSTYLGCRGGGATLPHHTLLSQCARFTACACVANMRRSDAPELTNARLCGVSHGSDGMTRSHALRVSLATSMRCIYVPTEGALHAPGDSSLSVGSSATLPGKETWSQFSRKVRHNRRRIRVIDVAAKMSYEYQMLKKMCRRRPAMRQWVVRDDFCDMSPGVVVMSPSMQAAYMKVFRLKDKGLIRRCLRDIIPVIEYRNRHEKTSSVSGFGKVGAAEMIPSGEPDTLNQKKRDLFERTAMAENFRPLRLHDTRSQAKLRFKIRQRLLSFQRQLAVANAVASRSVLYSSDDAVGYFLFRGAAMYAGLHRVLFELTKLLPHFCPKKLLDFGAGSGTAILVAKEVFDPAGLAYPLYRSSRQTSTHNRSAEAYQLAELRYDLQRLERNRAEVKKARFMAVAALLERREVLPQELPPQLRQEIARVAQSALAARRDRRLRESQARRSDVVDGRDWANDPSEVLQQTVPSDEYHRHRGDAAEEGGGAGRSGFAAAGHEDVQDTLPGENGDEDEEDGIDADGSNRGAGNAKTWWEQFIDAEANGSLQSKQQRAHARLRPLQEVTAIEPSPGMMEIGTMVLHSDVPNVTWRRYLLPEDETIQHDLVIAAYTLSEIASPEQRARIVQQLWKMTSGVLIFVEFANAANFDLLMTARDAILEHKDVGLWDWQPTIVAPCPHEHKCPLRFGKIGVKRKSMRVCQTEAQYRATFVEVWARRMPLTVGIEPITYLIFARNELVPERAERRQRAMREAARAATQDRQVAQRQLYEDGLGVGDVVFERLSEEALHRPQTGVPPRLPHALATDCAERSAQEAVDAERESSSGILHSSVDTEESSRHRFHVSTSHDEGSGASSSLPSDAYAASSSSSSSVSVSTGEIGHMPTDTPRLVQTSPDRVNRLIFPRQYPPATHRYNRGFVDAGYQRQRTIRPAEMLLVRSEVSQLRDRVSHVIHKYFRLVRDPVCRGKIQATFCTPQGSLVTARVYRRFYGDRHAVSRHKTMRWQHIGGWKLLRRIRAGSLFPADVPLYALRTVPQLDFPNTLLGGSRDESHIAKTAMQLNDPQTPVPVGECGEEEGDRSSAGHSSSAASTRMHRGSGGGDDTNYAGQGEVGGPTLENASPEEQRAERRRRRNKDLQEKAEAMLEELFGAHVAQRAAHPGVDGRSEISPEKWAEAVRRARVRTVQQTKLTIPYAGKMRAMKRMAGGGGSSSRGRQMRREMRSNRRR